MTFYDRKTSQAIQEFKEWREQLTSSLSRRRDALIDLIDALSSNQQATSVAELSLNPLFQRDYNSLYKEPISIGHTYSVVCALPDQTETRNVPWSIPLSCERVTSTNTPTQTGNQQLQKLWKNSRSSEDKLSVLVADCDYSQRGFIGEQVQQKNLVTITRVRSNRVFYRLFIDENLAQKRVGHPRWYGDKFDLSNDETWHEPDDTAQTSFTTKRGRHLTVTIKAWKQMLMRGTKTYKMNRHPFTLLQITVNDPTTNCPIWKPMWLIVIGTNRDELKVRKKGKELVTKLSRKLKKVLPKSQKLPD